MEGTRLDSTARQQIPSRFTTVLPVTRIAELGMSGIAVNKKLESLGYQEKVSGQWEATKKGEPYSRRLDTGKKHSNGTMVQQLKWLSSIVELLK